MTELSVHGIGWTVGGRHILDDVELTVADGSLVGLLGRNGSGKSSLLHIVAGLHKASRGYVHLDELDVHGMGNTERARRIAFLAQQADTELALRVVDVVRLGRTPWGEADSDHIVADAMRRTEVEHLAERRWPTLSGGERQRTQLARALAQQPSLLLLDEPTNHLDLAHQIGLLRLVRGLRVTTLTALHDLELAAAFCDRLIVLDEGRVVASGTPREVLTETLLEQVYSVSAQVTEHPITGRPHIQWNP